MAAGPGACNYIKEISISGDRKTKDAIILRELSVHTGDCIQDENLAAVLELNKLRLYNLRLFTDVKIAWAPVAEDTVRMEIIVLDRFPIMPGGNLEFADRNFNVWWTEQNRDLRRINLGLSINHNNFRGNRETITASVQVGYTQKLGLSYSRPFADKNQKHGYGASIFALQNREIAYITDNNKLKFLRSEDNYVQRRLDLAAWYTYRPAYATTHTLELSFHHYWISDTIRELNPGFPGWKPQPGRCAGNCVTALSITAWTIGTIHLRVTVSSEYSIRRSPCLAVTGKAA